MSDLRGHCIRLRYVATAAAAAAGSNIPPICRYKIEGCSTDSKNMKYNSSLQSLKLQIIISKLAEKPYSRAPALRSPRSGIPSFEKEYFFNLLQYVLIRSNALELELVSKL